MNNPTHFKNNRSVLFLRKCITTTLELANRMLASILSKSLIVILLLSLLPGKPLYSQASKCIDLGVGVGSGNGDYLFIDFFRDGGQWSALRYISGSLAHDTLRNWYRVYSLNDFKVVNGKYWHWDSDWSGTINNQAWGNSWADTYMSYWDMIIDQAKVDAKGFPLSVPLTIYKYKSKLVDPAQGIDNTQPITIGRFERRIYTPDGAPTNNWILRWKGKGQISFEGISAVNSANVTYSGSGNVTFTSTAGGRADVNYTYYVHGRVLRIISSDVTDPIRDIEFLFPGYEDEYDAGETYLPIYIDKMSQFKCLRWMGPLSSNSIECRTIVPSSHPFRLSHMFKEMQWSERTKPNWYEVNNGNGFAYEHIIAISNITKSDPWINIPYCAGEDYVKNLVQLVMNTLDPDRIAYFEFGNELWNYASGFNGYHWLAATRTTYYPGIGDVEARGARINDIFSWVGEAAGASNMSRIKRVYGAFSNYEDINNRSLMYVEPENWECYAFTFYFGLTNNNSSSNTCKDPVSGNNWRKVLYDWYLANPNDQAGFNAKYYECVRNEFHCDGSRVNSTDIKMARSYNKIPVCYEGGNHTFYGCTNAPTATQALQDYDGSPQELNFTGTYPDFITDNGFINRVCYADSRSAEMGLFYNEIIDSLQSAGVMLANHLGFSGRSSCYGVWSLIQTKDYLQDVSTLLSNYPKFKAYSDRKNASGCDAIYVNLPANSVGAGLSLMMDGFNDYAEANTIAKPNEGSDYSMELWFKPTLLDKNYTLLNMANGAVSNQYNDIKLRADNKIVWIVNHGTDSMKLTSGLITADKWYHVAVTKSGARYTLYVNGKNVASVNKTLAAVTKDRFSIGAFVLNSSSKEYFKGEVDEVRIWNVARSEADIREYMCKKFASGSVPASLTSYFRLDDGNNSTTLVNSGSGAQAGTIRNMGFSQNSRYAISGAPLGDISRYRYESSWTGIGLTLTHSQGDAIGVTNIAGSPDGAHIYCVNQQAYWNDVPQYYEGISNNKYYGVFMANGTEPSYDLNYSYNGNPQAKTGGEETKNRLLRRTGSDDEAWLHSGGKLDVVSQSFSLSCKEMMRGEYTLGFRRDDNVARPGSGQSIRYVTAAADGIANGMCRYMPMYTDYTFTCWAKGNGMIYEMGRTIGQGDNEFFTIGASGSSISVGWRKGADGRGTNSGNGDPNEWNHYAVSRKGTKITIYVNGMNVFSQDWIGTTSFNQMKILCPYSWMGAQNLQMDEVSLWNSALDQATIRDWMCKKVTGLHPNACKNLLLYFTFDEGQGTVLEDKFGASDMVCTPTYYNYVTSGAAIGNVSTHDYITPNDISFAHPQGDLLSATRSVGSAVAVHLYRNDFTPPLPTPSAAGINSIDSSRYWGLFVAKAAGTTTNYEVSYQYAGNASINPGHETELRLLSRKDNATTTWTSNLAITPSGGTIKLPTQFRGEYILGGILANTILPSTAPATPTITGPTTICGNSAGLVYRASYDPMAAQYIWSLPTGLDGFSTADSIVISAAYLGATPQNFTISVVAVNNIGQSAPPGTLTITVNPMPTLSDAGPDLLVIPPATTATMDGNAAGAGETGTWSPLSGTGTFASPNGPTTTVSGIGSGVNVYAWTISQNSGSCPPSIDSTTVIMAPPPDAITLEDGTPIPSAVCGGTIITLKATPNEYVASYVTGYLWIVPAGMTVMSQNDATGTAQIQMAASGIGGKIQVSALYGFAKSPSLPLESISISIRTQPNKPVFISSTPVLCLNVTDTIKASLDATIDSFVWTLPEGVYPVEYPKPTSASIEVKASQMVSGTISVKAFNNGCTNVNAADSFTFVVSQAPPKPSLYLGTDGGTADQICSNNDAILWVANNDTNSNYVWSTNTGFTIVEYFGSNRYGVKLNQYQNQPEAYVRAELKSGGVCSVSETFTFNSWPQTQGPVIANPITFQTPSGQDPMLLQVGQTYTITMAAVTNASAYFWILPDGALLIKDNNSGDNVVSFTASREFAGDILCYVISLRGCTGVPASITVSTPNGILPPEYVSGTTTICAGTNLSITVRNVGADQYIFTLPDGTTFTETSNVLIRQVNVAMKGDMSVVAVKGTSRSNPALISIQVDASIIAPMTFVDKNNNPIYDISVCASYADGSNRYPVIVRDVFAAEYGYAKGGAPIDWETRYCPIHSDPNSGAGCTHNPTCESFHHLVRDTSYSFGWTSWRMQDGNLSGYIKVYAYANPTCSNNVRVDSIYWHYDVSPNVVQPTFTEAPLSVCAGSKVTYKIAPISGATQYVWSLPSGLSAASIQTTIPQIIVDVAYGTGGIVSVYAISSACGGGETAVAYTENISIEGAPVDFHFIQAPSAACNGDVLTYTVNEIGSSQYLWTLPGGGSTIQIDDSDATGFTTGGTGWSTGTFAAFVNGNYHQVNNNTPGAYARYTPTIALAGVYHVSISTAYIYNNATSVNVHVVDKNGQSDVIVNELVASGPTHWLDIGDYEFDAGTSGYVDIATTTSNQIVRADAVRFELLGTPDDTSMTFTVSGSESGSVCVSAPIPGCTSNFTICTEVNLGGELLNPYFTAQAIAVCEGETYTYTINSIGADSLVWTLPTGWSIDGDTGVVTLPGNISSVEVVVGPNSAIPQKITVYGKLKCGNKVSTVASTSDIVFGGVCKLAVPIFIAQPQSICLGATATFSVSPVANADNYLWTLPAGLEQQGTGATGTIITTASSIVVTGVTVGTFGQITVQAQSAIIPASEIATTTDGVTVTSSANAGADSTGSACSILPSVDLNSYLRNNDIGGTWTDITNSGALTGSDFYPSLVGAGIYNFSYKVITTGSCASEDSAIITLMVVGLPTESLSVNDTSACFGEPVVITVKAAEAGVSYVLRDATDNIVSDPITPLVAQDIELVLYPSAATTGTHVLKISADVGGSCAVDLSTQPTVTISAKPMPVIVGVDNICPLSKGEQYSITAQPNCNYLWTMVSGTAEIVSTSNTENITVDFNENSVNTLTVIVTDSISLCAGSDTIMIYSQDTIAPVFTVCPGNIALLANYDPERLLVYYEVQGTELDALATDNCSGLQFSNSTNLDTTLLGYKFIFDPADKYEQVIVWDAIDVSGNRSSCRVLVEFKVDEDIHVFSAFSPNVDGINDVWKIKNIELHPKASVTVFDRWGTIVYSNNNKPYIDKQWNGESVNGNPLPVETYHYIIDLKNGKKIIRGTVTIIR